MGLRNPLLPTKSTLSVGPTHPAPLSERLEKTLGNCFHFRTLLLTAMDPLTTDTTTYPTDTTAGAALFVSSFRGLTIYPREGPRISAFNLPKLDNVRMGRNVGSSIRMISVLVSHRE